MHNMTIFSHTEWQTNPNITTKILDEIKVTDYIVLHEEYIYYWVQVMEIDGHNLICRTQTTNPQTITCQKCHVIVVCDEKFMLDF